MNPADSPQPPHVARKARSDGWTPERQLRFLDALARTRSVTSAARAAGMSRESAYRLRSRKEGLLFAHLWGRLMQPDSGSNREVHTQAVSDGRLARLLGNHFRRERGDFLAISSTEAKSLGSDRTRPL